MCNPCGYPSLDLRARADISAASLNMADDARRGTSIHGQEAQLHLSRMYTYRQAGPRPVLGRGPSRIAPRATRRATQKRFPMPITCLALQRRQTESLLHSTRRCPPCMLLARCPRGESRWEDESSRCSQVVLCLRSGIHDWHLQLRVPLNGLKWSPCGKKKDIATVA